MAEPKNTGVWRPARNASRSKAGMASRTSSISWLARGVLGAKAPGQGRLVGAVEYFVLVGAALLTRTKHPHGVIAQVVDAVKALALADGPGQGAQGMPRVASISSSRSRGSRTSRSSLLMKVRMGVLRARQTSIRRRVWASTPLAASITIRAASTAVSTR